MPLHACKQKSIARSIRDILDYGKNPEKTDGGRLVSCYERDPDETSDQFIMKKQIYEQITHRKETNNERNVIVYQIRQSFAPEDNITPERANELGMELARNFTHSGTRAGNDFQIVVCTHIDTLATGGVIHNHIYFNSTSLDCSRKFDNEFNTAEKVQVLSDELCHEDGLHVIEEKGNTGVSYDVAMDKKNGLDWKAIFKADIDELIPQCKSLEEFKQKLKNKGYSLRGKKSLSITHPDRKRGMKTERIDGTLDYSLDGIEYALKHNGRMLPKKKKINFYQGSSLLGHTKEPPRCDSAKKVNLLHELEGKTGGLKFWAKKKNLKELSKAYSYLKEHGMSDYGGLIARMDNLQNKFDFTSDKIKQIESELKKANTLKVHITNYAKTVQTYKAYNSSRHKEKFYEEHKGDILLHEASRQAFKSLGLRTIPKTTDLKANIESLKMEKSTLYTTYKELRAVLKELQPVKQNFDSFLAEQNKQQVQEKRKQEQER